MKNEDSTNATFRAMREVHGFPAELLDEERNHTHRARVRRSEVAEVERAAWPEYAHDLAERQHLLSMVEVMEDVPPVLRAAHIRIGGGLRERT